MHYKTACALHLFLPAAAKNYHAPAAQAGKHAAGCEVCCRRQQGLGLGIRDVDSKKVILLPVIISIIGHTALIAISSMIDLRDNVKAAEIFTVSIKEPEAAQSLKKGAKKEGKRPSEPKEAKAINGAGWREDTVNLDSDNVRYASYLIKIKRKLLQIWQYPPQAYEKNEEGVVVVKMSIDVSGSLAEANIINSSGSILLDEGAIGVVKASAPFEPLPDNYGLSRLHIVASFRYKLIE